MTREPARPTSFLLMLIALLAVLGVNLGVIVALLAVVLSRRRWVKRQAGTFRGAIRVSGGEVDGLRPRWSRGYGRWVGDVLVWTHAPFLFRNTFVLAAEAGPERAVQPNEVKRLGDEPVLFDLRVTGGAEVQVAAPGEDRAGLRGPFGLPAVAAGPARPAATVE